MRDDLLIASVPRARVTPAGMEYCFRRNIKGWCMKFSTKVRYGIRIMVDLANHKNENPVLARSISDRQEISKKYLESLLTTLKMAGLVRTIRGAKGGYILSRDPGKITLEQITSAMDGPLSLVECVESPAVCKRSKHCAARDLWKDVAGTLKSKFRGTTLADLAQKTARKEKRAKPKKAKAGK